MFTTDQIALQLYTVRDAMKQDYFGALGAVAGAGYTAVEFAGYGDHTPAQVRARIDELGLRAMGAHVQATRVMNDLDGAIEDVKTLGGEFVIIPYLAPTEYFTTPDQVRKLAETLNGIGPKVKAAGLGFLYHNHNFEFTPFADGSETLSPYELLLTLTDPESVGFELDVFWAEVAGQTGHRLIREYPNRFPSLHIKDMDDAREDAPVGTGKLSWQPVLEAGEQVGGSRWLVVEQDNPKDPMADIATSFTNLSAIVSGS
jgi:sugar phosphate isomerase/epimerase